MPHSEYGATSKLLHRFALASPFVAQASHDLESLLNRQSASREGDRHVFVAGLARAGTTVLMRSLYLSGQFRSLTYRDMPFVLMPKTWSGISSVFRQHKAEAERAHGDRVMVNFDSPEAFEEVFWRSFCGADYIREDRLQPHRPEAETISQFRRFVGNVLASGEANAKQQRYLSKNNNNLLRLPAIAEAFPEAAIFIPFRDPVEHALSLKKQHERFLELHDQDLFACDYMTWLGHHEFGGNHRPFRFHRLDAEIERYRPNQLDYWLTCWCHTYAHVLDNKPASALLVSYETLCEQQALELERIMSHAAVESGAWKEDVSFHKSSSHAAAQQPSLDPALRRRAYELYDALSACR